MRMRNGYILILIALVAMATGCRREPLYDDKGGNIYLDIEIERELARDNDPVSMIVRFFHPERGQSLSWTSLPYEGGLVSVLPDTYDIMVYNYDTEYTAIRDEEYRDRTEAYTNEVPNSVRRSFEAIAKAITSVRDGESRGYSDDPVIHQPDHLYVGTLPGVKVPMSISDDDVLYLHVTARSLCETYILNISTVSGQEYIQMADVFVTGQARTRRLYDRECGGESSTLYVPLITTRTNTLSTTFHTFGQHPGENVYVILRIVTLDNKVMVWEWNVNDQYCNGTHVINVETDIEVPPPTVEGGGFVPEVQEWDDTHIPIDI